MIRQATQLDVGNILGLVLRYYAEHGYEAQSGISLDVNCVERLTHFLLRSPNGILIVDADGPRLRGICAGVISKWFGNDEKLAITENICYGPNTVAMRAAFDEVARTRGVSAAIISCFVQADGPRIRKL
jgi:hypothetical protein